MNEAPNDIAARRRKIEELIAEDALDQGFKYLLDFARDFTDDTGLINEAIVVSADCHRLMKLERRGTEAPVELERKRRRLLFHALELLDSVQESFGIRGIA